MPPKLTVPYLQQFIGNPAAWAEQMADGTWVPRRSPLNAGVLRKHLSHELTAGTYTNVVDKARTLVLDIDDEPNTMDVAMALRRVLIDSFKVPASSIGIEFSGKKGHHVIVMLQHYVQAEMLQRLGRAAIALAGAQGR
jgi:hypothetical protein